MSDYETESFWVSSEFLRFVFLLIIAAFDDLYLIQTRLVLALNLEYSFAITVLGSDFLSFENMGGVVETGENTVFKFISWK